MGNMMMMPAHTYLLGCIAALAAASAKKQKHGCKAWPTAHHSLACYVDFVGYKKVKTYWLAIHSKLCSVKELDVSACLLAFLPECCCCYIAQSE
jgi:hypothetical protein